MSPLPSRARHDQLTTLTHRICLFAYTLHPNLVRAHIHPLSHVSASFASPILSGPASPIRLTLTASTTIDSRFSTSGTTNRLASACSCSHIQAQDSLCFLVIGTRCPFPTPRPPAVLVHISPHCSSHETKTVIPTHTPICSLSRAQ
ncbi:hypothetical protein BV20DRAFT_967057 [Pilatotrama ljubarskyi]|nr:hypothetical protein BV20DRAFT_967057 [Pilatotrama ljubarskyi]